MFELCGELNWIHWGCEGAGKATGVFLYMEKKRWDSGAQINDIRG